ncbi:MAG: hypothetical protein ACK4YF_09310 [Exilispira sp.]
MDDVKLKVWHLARFSLLLIIITIFIISLIYQSLIKSIIFSFFIFFIFILKGFRKSLSLIVKLLLVFIPIIFLRSFTFLVYGKLKSIILINEMQKLSIQFLNISNSILFSSLFFHLAPVKNPIPIESMDKIIKDIDKKSFKIKSISSIFAYLIYECYKSFYKINS